MESKIIRCKECIHCFKDQRSKTGYSCEMWGYDDFANPTILTGWCYKARHAKKEIRDDGSEKNER